jgi:putative Ca2+/H+ antiporter (TMEM165/GDT1 family)
VRGRTDYLALSYQYSFTVKVPSTLVTFFFAEMGGKKQIATVAFTAHYATPWLVIAGNTLGMLIAAVPAVFVGNNFAAKIPMKVVHSIATGIFAIMGVLTLLKVDRFFH